MINHFHAGPVSTFIEVDGINMDFTKNMIYIPYGSQVILHCIGTNSLSWQSVGTRYNMDYSESKKFYNDELHINTLNILKFDEGNNGIYTCVNEYSYIKEDIFISGGKSF